MLKSMTGFGRAKYQVEGREYIVEIKSVNYKYSDVSVRLPRNISYLEEFIKKEVLKNVSRGKIDVNITFNNCSSLGKNVSVNNEIAEMYIKSLRRLVEDYGVKDDITAVNVSKMPDVLEIKSEDDEEQIKSEILIPLKEAINNFIEMKQKEGNELAKDMQARIKDILNKVEKVSELSTGLIEDYVVKLEARIKEILKSNEVDKQRLEQEVVIYADKCSIAEEVTRLKSHIEQFESLINEKEYITIGKKLDFIIQEMNRETNTIGSKANCLEITNEVINIKTEIENIREQVQNIE